jgi:hypothetical protein
VTTFVSRQPVRPAAASLSGLTSRTLTSFAAWREDRQNRREALHLLRGQQPIDPIIVLGFGRS